jgi:superfamily I DNA/RNA helicase
VAVAAGSLVGSDGVLGELVAEERAAVGEGRVAVLVPSARVGELRIALLGEPGARAVEAVEAAEGEIDDFADPEDLEAPVVVLPVTAAKGLEFDSVVLVEPAEVLAESPRGLNDLYVAITRATQRLTVVHHDELPEALKRLRRG